MSPDRERAPAALEASPWPGRLVAAAVVVLVPLFLFGGSVTTLGAGLAVEGWWNAEGHFMPFFPVEKWFRDLHTFVEHSHRLIGMVLGLLMVAAVVATWRADPRPRARGLVLAALAGVCVQGWIGGSRVLEASPRLAFLHGAFAQLVFALMAAVLVHQSRAWRAAPRGPSPRAAGLRRAAVAAALFVYGQIVLGAFYRHALRNPGLFEDPGRALALHLGGAFAALGAVALLAARLGAAADAGDPGSATLGALRRRLIALVAVQMGLGFLAWGARRGGAVEVPEWAFATAHVLVGAALLAHCVMAAMWSWRALERGEHVGAPARGALAGDGGAA